MTNGWDQRTPPLLKHTTDSNKVLSRINWLIKPWLGGLYSYLRYPNILVTYVFNSLPKRVGSFKLWIVCGLKDKSSFITIFWDLFPIENLRDLKKLTYKGGFRSLFSDASSPRMKRIKTTTVINAIIKNKLRIAFYVTTIMWKLVLI